MSYEAKFEKSPRLGDLVAQRLADKGRSLKEFGLSAPRRTRTKKESHVRFQLLTVYCRHCGERYTFAGPVPLSILGPGLKGFDKEHKKCRKTEKGLLCYYCYEFGHSPLDCPSLNVATPEEWLSGPDTGASSIQIYRTLNNLPPDGRVAVPYDPSDFGRCYRFLKLFPDYRARLDEMRVHAAWVPLVAAWAELEALYEAGLSQRPKQHRDAGMSGEIAEEGFQPLYTRMRELLKK